MSKRTQRSQNEMSRRDLIKKGGQTFLGMTLLPTLGRSLRISPAHADQSAKAAYLHFYLPGGYTFASDFKALGAGGASLPAAAYAVHGANPTGQADQTWGAPIWNTVGNAPTTSLVNQLKAKAISPNVKFATWAALTNDDLSAAAMNPCQTVAFNLDKARHTSFKTVSNHSREITDLQTIGGYAPVLVKGFDGYAKLLNPKIGPLANLSDRQLGAISHLAAAVSGRHQGELQGSGAVGTETLQSSLGSGYQSLVKSFSSPAVAPPNSDPIIQKWFPIKDATDGALASMTKMLIDQVTQVASVVHPGFFSSGNLETFGPWDIHFLSGAQAFSSGMSFWEDVIAVIGALSEAKIPFYIDITTNGAAYYDKAVELGGAPIGDAARISMGVSVAYNPDSTVSPFKQYQVGEYLPNGNVKSDAHPISSNETDLAVIRAASALNFFGFDARQDPFLSTLSDYAITRKRT